MKRSRILIALALTAAFSFNLTACAGNSYSLPGTGEPGVVEALDWSRYDELLYESTQEADPLVRSRILHEAEDMLIETGAIGPLTASNTYSMIKSDVKNVRTINNGCMDVTHIEKITGEDSVRICLCTEVSKMDPPANTTHDIAQIIVNTYANLLNKDENDNYELCLAESYSVSEDGKTYEFVLKDGLKWSDGSDFDARDFEYSWKRAAATENAFEYSNMFDCISGYPDNLDVTASEDGKTLTVKLISPTAYFLELVCQSPYAPVQKKQVESAKGYKDASGNLLNPSAWAADGPIVSNGAYVIDEWVHNEKITLKKNPYYYDADNVKMETVTMMLTSDSASAYSAYLSGDVSVLYEKVPSDVLPEVMDSDEFHLIRRKNSSVLVFNVKSPLFAGMTKEEAITFRKAMFNIVDREFLAAILNPATIEPCGTFVPRSMSDGTGKNFSETEDFSYPEKDGYYKSTPDLDKARDMLRSIGYEFGADGKLKNPITIEYMYSGTANNEAQAVALQADFAQLGINLSLTSREWAVFLGEANNLNFELIVSGWNADFDDPYNFLSLYTSYSPNNKAGLGR